MNAEYKYWIDNYKGDIYRKCIEVTNEMKKNFPELVIVQGLVQIIENCKWYEHQWLEDIEGNIIDPTKKQWAGIIEYKKIGKGDNKPIGKCPNCGEWIFENGYSSFVCSEKCEQTYNSYLMDGIRRK